MVLIISQVGTQYKLIENIDDLGTHEALRSGYILYFRFLKHSGLLLSIIFVISGLFNIISNLASGDCEPNGTKISDTDPRLCSKDFITIFTIANKKDHDDLITAQAALNLIALLVMVCYFHYMRIDFRYIVLKEDEEDTPSDYTLRIDGLKDIKPEWSNTEIKDYFNNLFKGKEAVHVVNVIRTFKISEYVQSRNKLERYKNRLKTAQNKITQEENSRKKGVAEKLAMLTTMDDKTREAEHKKIAQAEEVDRKIKEIEDYKLEQYKRKVTKHERKILKYQQQGLEYGSSVFVTFEYPEGISLHFL